MLPARLYGILSETMPQQCVHAVSALPDHPGSQLSGAQPGEPPHTVPAVKRFVDVWLPGCPPLRPASSPGYCWLGERVGSSRLSAHQPWLSQVAVPHLIAAACCWPVRAGCRLQELMSRVQGLSCPWGSHPAGAPAEPVPAPGCHCQVVGQLGRCCCYCHWVGETHDDLDQCPRPHAPLGRWQGGHWQKTPDLIHCSQLGCLTALLPAEVSLTGGGGGHQADASCQ